MQHLMVTASNATEKCTFVLDLTQLDITPRYDKFYCHSIVKYRSRTLG